MLNPVLGGAGGGLASEAPSQVFVCHCQRAGDGELKVKGHSLPIFCEVEIDLSGSKSGCYEPAQRGEHDDVILYISRIKKVINEKPSTGKTIIFHLMTSGAKTADGRSNLVETRYREMKRAPQCFFEFCLAII